MSHGFSFARGAGCEVCSGPCARGVAGNRGINMCAACGRSLDRWDDVTSGGLIRWAARMARKHERKRNRRKKA